MQALAYIYLYSYLYLYSYSSIYIAIYILIYLLPRAYLTGSTTRSPALACRTTSSPTDTARKYFRPTSNGHRSLSRHTGWLGLVLGLGLGLRLELGVVGINSMQ